MQVVIEGAMVVDGASTEPMQNGTVVIEDSRIKYVGPDSGFTRQPDAQVITASGATVLPGLIDVHVHITNDGGPAGTISVLQASVRSEGEDALRGYANAARSLHAGYTTLRDLNAPGISAIALRNMIDSGRLQGSRLLVCGQGLCITGGHMDMTSLPHEVTGRVGVCDSPEGFRAAVRYWVKMGVDLIKINSDVGLYGNPSVVSVQEMSFEEMVAACSEAHKFGRHVAAHTAGGGPLEDAVKAGVDSIEHGHWLTDRAIELMLERGAYYVPTLIVNTANFWYSREDLGVSEGSWDWLKRANEDKWDSLERAHKAGVRIAAGSDAGFLVDHTQNAAELEELVKGGLTPMEAIQAATKTAAELLRMEGEIGTLSPGKLADVIVVTGNPLEDITLLQQQDRITHVFKAGAAIKSPELSRVQAGQEVTV